MTQARLMPGYWPSDRPGPHGAGGRSHRPPGSPTGRAALLQQASGKAMLYDADIFRSMTEILTMQALPEEVFARPGFAGQ
jgi:hypothetical protein